MRLSAIRFIFAVAFAVSCIAFFRDTLAQGQDFLVFYHAAQAWWHGSPIYDLVRDGGMIFKYPPWIIPFFLPFAFLSEDLAKGAWALVQLLSLFYILMWCWKTFQIRIEILQLTFFLFWGIWVTHFLDGQVTLVFMALSMACYSAARGRALLAAFAGVFLSTKIYSLLGMVPFFFDLSRARQARRSFAWLSGAILLFLILFLVGFVLIRSSVTIGFFDLIGQWLQAAASGIHYLGEDKVLGRANQSLTALFLRGLWWGFPHFIDEVQKSFGFSADLFFGGIGFVCAAAFLITIRERVSRDVFFAVALALIPVIHPLPWIHGFTLAFPVFAFVFAKSDLRKSKYFGVFLLCLASRNTLGMPGEWLELLSVKGFGVLLLISLALKTGPTEKLKISSRF